MPANEQEVSRLMAIKGAILATKSTQGWQFIQQIAQNIEKAAIQEALDEDDPVKGEAKRVLAKATRKAFGNLWQAVDATVLIDPQADFGTGLGELERE